MVRWSIQTAVLGSALAGCLGEPNYRECDELPPGTPGCENAAAPARTPDVGQVADMLRITDRRTAPPIAPSNDPDFDSLDAEPRDAASAWQDWRLLEPDSARGPVDLGPDGACPGDAEKAQPGLCGCGVPDTDTDDDGTPDCNDECAENPLRNRRHPFCECDLDTTTDSDGDTWPDCIEARCPDGDDADSVPDCIAL